MEKEGIIKSFRKLLLKWERTLSFISRFTICAIITHFVFAVLAFVKIGNIVTVLGAVLSFFFIRIGQFFLDKFLEKKAHADDFSYIKEAISIVLGDIIVFLLFPFIFAQLLFSGFLNDKVNSNYAFLYGYLSYVMFLSGILTFSYRTRTLKTKLLNLQANYTSKEH